MNYKEPKLTGISLTKEGFQVYESDQTINIHYVNEVLSGNLAAYRIRNYLPIAECEQISKNFWQSPKRVPRYGDGENGVEGHFIGASHIDKTTNEYLREAQEFSGAIEHLYVNTVNPIANFRNTLKTDNNKYSVVRPAMHSNYQAGDSKAVYWSDLGEFLLKPHDDVAQLSDPRQNGFEIQRSTRVMAVNFYAQVPADAGQLKMWNIEPDDICRQNLNLTYSGFPYPAELLKNYSSIVIPVATGDLCVINGNLVHAVMRGNNNVASSSRLLITCFMSFNEANELIWWT